jgi:hypothetical protein
MQKGHFVLDQVQEVQQDVLLLLGVFQFLLKFLIQVFLDNAYFVQIVIQHSKYRQNPYCFAST